MNISASWLPTGYSLIQGATFAGETFGDFGFKQTPMTNGEWGDWFWGLGEDRFVLMHHDRNTGATQILSRGRDVKAVLGEGLSPKQKLNWDAGDILVSGSLVLFKLVENPSQVFDERKRDGSASVRYVVSPDDRDYYVGFSPVVVREENR